MIGNGDIPLQEKLREKNKQEMKRNRAGDEVK